MSGPALQIRAAKRLGAFWLDVDFAAPPGVTALFGRSGAGKTSVAQVAAGLLRPDAGRVALGETVLFDAALGIDLPARRRRIGYVFQEGRLFPHLTVRGNLLFGARFSGGAPAPGEFDRVTALLGIEPLLARRPAGLSGGEQQRVAIGRALLSRPRLLIMDEPLAALDQPRKAEILPYLERLAGAAGVPILYVSHALEEVSRLATTIVALEAGRVARIGPAAELLSDPSAFPLMGRQEAGAILEARVAAEPPRDGLTALELDLGAAAPLEGRLRLYVARSDLTAGERVRLRIRARDVMLAVEPPTGLSALNILPVEIAEISDAEGAVTEVALAVGEARLLARVTRRAAATLGLAPGKRVFAVLKSAAIGRRDLLRGAPFTPVE